MSCLAPAFLATFGFAPGAAPTTACSGSCRNASLPTGTWWTCCGLSFSPCSTYRGQSDVGVARTGHRSVAGPDGADLRDDVGTFERSVQPRGRGGRNFCDRCDEG